MKNIFLIFITTVYDENGGAYDLYKRTSNIEDALDEIKKVFQREYGEMYHAHVYDVNNHIIYNFDTITKTLEKSNFLIQENIK
jgi:hypothetical protein